MDVQPEDRKPLKLSPARRKWAILAAIALFVILFLLAVLMGGPGLLGSAGR